MPEGKVIHIRLDKEYDEKLQYCLEYYQKDMPMTNKSDIVKLAIHCLYVDLKEIKNENNT